MQFPEHSKQCSCPPMPSIPCPPPCPVVNPAANESSKYYREIGTEILGNQLIIRVERDKNKSKKKRDSWDPPCDCETIEIQRPTSKQGPKILNRGDSNRIQFQILPNSQLLPEDEENVPQTISYQVGSCLGQRDPKNRCRIITIQSQEDREGSQEVHTDHITDDNENVFFLRVKKKPEPDEKKKKIELELRTPRPPTPPPEIKLTRSKSISQMQKKKKKKGK